MRLSPQLSSLVIGGALITQAACTAVTAHADVVAPQPPKAVTKTISSYILLDRTGSMRGIWDEALGSVNAYVDELGKPEEDGTIITSTITLAAFDYQGGFQFDVIRDGISPADWVSVTDAEITPRGMTPLFDGIGQILSRAQADQPETAIIVIMTDGRENSSKELTSANAKQALDKAKAKGWEVVFLGADFAAFGDAQAVGVSAKKSMAISPENMQRAQRSLANKVKGYAKGEEAEIAFDSYDRQEAGEEDVKSRKGE